MYIHRCILYIYEYMSKSGRHVFPVCVYESQRCMISISCRTRLLKTGICKNANPLFLRIHNLYRKTDLLLNFLTFKQQHLVYQLSLFLCGALSEMHSMLCIEFWLKVRLNRNVLFLPHTLLGIEMVKTRM